MGGEPSTIPKWRLAPVARCLNLAQTGTRSGTHQRLVCPPGAAAAARDQGRFRGVMPINASSQAGEIKRFPGRCPVGIVRLQGYVMSSNGTLGVSDWPSGTRVPERSGQQITVSKSGRHGVMSFS